MSIMRGHRAFVQLTKVGECNESGKEVLSFSLKGKAIADPDRAMDLVIGFIHKLLPHAHYSSSEALEADLKRLKVYIDGIGEQKPEKELAK
ncbi:hypothetical protein [Singulisphaera sp. PoT]|uniref:hypothetical protein n=1 Tax=Singulisphaera sp. PoT TaxID=3411797 RepID=UPI003BF4E2E1